MTEYLAASDSFGRTATLAFERAFPVLGVPLEVRSNARGAIDLAEVSFGAWRGLEASLVRQDCRARLDIVVLDSDENDALPAQLVYRRHGPVFLAAAGTSLFAVLLKELHAVCFVPAHALDDEEWFTAHVNGCGLVAVSQRDRVPFHAAAVVSDGQAFLLMGASGIGKSTLTRACRAEGFDVMSDDAVFIALDGAGPRLWGHTRCIWLDPRSLQFFPELAGQRAIDRANGKRRVPASAGGARAPVLSHAGPVVLVVLDRVGSVTSLEPLPREEATAVLAQAPEEGFDQYPEGRPAVLRWLAALPSHRLHLGDDPAAAARVLKSLAQRETERGTLSDDGIFSKHFEPIRSRADT